MQQFLDWKRLHDLQSSNYIESSIQFSYCDCIVNFKAYAA